MRPQAVPKDVQGDAVQPGAGLQLLPALLVPAGKRLVGPEEGLLGDLFRVGRVTAKVQGEPEDAVLVSVHELLEGHPLVQLNTRAGRRVASIGDCPWTVASPPGTRPGMGADLFLLERATRPACRALRRASLQGGASPTGGSPDRTRFQPTRTRSWWSAPFPTKAWRTTLPARPASLASARRPASSA